MKRHISIRPISILYTVGGICLVVLIAVYVGAPYYVKYSMQKWAKTQQFELHVEGISLTWELRKMPSVAFKNVNLINKGANPTFTHIDAQSISIDPYVFDFLKPYMTKYHASLQVKVFKVHFTGGNVLEADRIRCNIDCKDTLYKFTNFHLRPFRLKLNESSSSSRVNPHKTSNEGHLVLYEINGGGQFDSFQKALELYLKVPPASAQMPDGKTYAVQAKGKIKFLELMPYQQGKNPDDPGIRGKITYTIDNFSNFLHHLKQADIISTIAESLGTIIGYPSSRVDPFTEQTEIFTNAVTIDMTFMPDGVYVGPMKL